MLGQPRGRPFKPGQSGNPGGRPRVIGELHDLARAHAPDAIKELARLAKNAKSETARIAAIRELLDRAYGKATQFVAAENDGPDLNDLNLESCEHQFLPIVSVISLSIFLAPKPILTSKGNCRKTLAPLTSIGAGTDTDPCAGSASAGTF